MADPDGPDGPDGVEVRDNPDAQRYEAWLDEELAGVAVYELDGEEIRFLHTEVRVEGKGVGSALVRGALDAVRRDGELRVVPRCPFVAAWIDKHPDYQDLLAS